MSKYRIRFIKQNKIPLFKMLHRKLPKPYKLFPPTTLISLLVFYVIPTIHGLAFLHTSIGVVFSPYVHNEVNNENIHHDWMSYDLTDVETMAKLISTRFPKLISYGIGSIWHDNDSDHYSWDTNYHQSYSQVYVCEAVAMLNNASHHEHEENKINNKGKNEDQEFTPLQVYQGVLVSQSRARVDLELFIAVEAIKKANRLFPGTVPAILFHTEASMQNDAKTTDLVFEAIKQIELKAAQYQIKIGTKQNCEGISEGMDEKKLDIIKHSNFIICEVLPSLDMHVDDAVVWVIGKIKKYRKELKTLNPWMGVMFETGWPADEGKKFQTEELQMFWEYMEAWSLKHDVSLWMNEAFDTPWSYEERKRHWGWWKLKSDGQTSKEDGYIEKVPHKGVKYTRKTRGKALANGKKTLERLEKLLPKKEAEDETKDNELGGPD